MNYTDLSNDELDRLLAERFGYTYINSAGIDAVRFNLFSFELIYRKKKDYPLWNPTSPDSNQLERFVLPELHKKGCPISMVYGKANLFWIAVEKWEDGKQLWAEGFSCEDADQINRTKAICTLMTWDRLEESK